MEAKKAERARKIVLCAGFVCCIFFSRYCIGGTVFVAERGLHRINAYPFDGQTFSQPTVIDYGHDEFIRPADPVYGLGPIDLAVDEAHNVLFVSFESRSSSGEQMATPHILLIHSRTLEVLNTIQISQARDIGGLYYHPAKGKLYGIERNSNRICQMGWNPQKQTLVFEQVLFLPNSQNACALVMDGDRAFVSEFTYGETMEYSAHIKEYNTAGGGSWSYVRTIPMGAETTCLAYDPCRKIFYSGAYDYYNTYHSFAKHLTEPNDSIRVKDIGHNVTDADVDKNSGYVFTTGYLGEGWPGPDGVLEIWDTSGWTEDPEQEVAPLASTTASLAGPAGVLYIKDNPLPQNLRILKVDDVNDDPNFITCILPGEDLTYTIFVDPNNTDHAWVKVIDYLPRGVDYDYILDTNPLVIDANYNPVEHTYTWLLGPLNAEDEPVALNLKVTVNERAEPLGELINYVTAESNAAFDEVYLKTPVCLFGGDVIYVDQKAPEGGNGTSWDLAYQRLSDGLERALAMKETPADPNVTVLVAGGTYKPLADVTAGFVVVRDASVYGGYAGYGATNPNARNLKKYETILSGFIGYDALGNERRNETVVEMQDNTLLDGCIVEKGERDNIKGIDSSFILTNCIVKNNTEIGLFCKNGNLTVQWCEISNNGSYGIYHFNTDYNNYDLTVQNSKITENQQNGIYVNATIPAILNCEISFNGSSGNYYGINLLNPPSNPLIRNCTIVHNVNEGIRYSGASQFRPDVRNCILFANNADDDYMDISGFSNTWYCCLTDPNHLEGPPLADPPTDGQGNMRTYPGFAYPDPSYRNFHLAADSPCIDAGDPDEQAYVRQDEVDLDGDDRAGDGSVDIGADEVACRERIGNPNDWNGDGVINYEEFSVFSAAWLSLNPEAFDPNLVDPNDLAAWNPLCNLDPTGDSEHIIDMADFIEFCDPNNWLWVACWRHDLPGYSSMMMGDGEGMQGFTPMTESLETASKQEVYEPDPETLKQNILLILEEIEKDIGDGQENLEALFEIKAFLEEVLWDLQNANP